MARSADIPHLIYEVTGDCNLRCRYCYNIWHAPGGGAAPSGDYSRNARTLGTIFRQARVSGVTFTGGEPLLAERFAELVLMVRVRGKRVTVITNGNAGDLEQYRTLVSLGVDLFEVPQHAADPLTHDRLTSVPGSWERARGSIETLLTLGAHVVAVVVLTRINVSDLERTLAHLQRTGVRDVLLARFNPGGRGLREWRWLLPTLEQLRGAFRLADRLAREMHLRISANVCTPVCVLDPRDYRTVSISRCSPDPARRPITLDPAGNLRFCNHSPVVAGNIYREHVGTILAGDVMGKWRGVVSDRCRGCHEWARCLGGCRAAAEQMGYDLAATDPVVARYRVFPKGRTVPEGAGSA